MMFIYFQINLNALIKTAGRQSVCSNYFDACFHSNCIFRGKREKEKIENFRKGLEKFCEIEIVDGVFVELLVWEYR